MERGLSVSSEDEETSKLKKMKPHAPGIVIFADHSRPLPWSVTYHAVVMFADISGFTALCEKYSTMGQSGVDQLQTTLNTYLSALVDGILGSDGDILKFAG
ncbi:Adenylate cyclase type 10 [Mactra antiquata]